MFLFAPKLAAQHFTKSATTSTSQCLHHLLRKAASGLHHAAQRFEAYLDKHGYVWISSPYPSKIRIPHWVSSLGPPKILGLLTRALGPTTQTCLKVRDMRNNMTYPSHLIGGEKERGQVWGEGLYSTQYPEKEIVNRQVKTHVHLPTGSSYHTTYLWAFSTHKTKSHPHTHTWKHIIQLSGIFNSWLSITNGQNCILRIIRLFPLLDLCYLNYWVKLLIH